MSFRTPKHPRDWPRLILWVVAGLLLAVIVLLAVLQLTLLWRHAFCVYLPLLPFLLGLLAALNWQKDRYVAIFYLVLILAVFAAILMLNDQFIHFYQILFRLLLEQ